jgi:sec-independent protein translocase protein TatB
VFDVGFSELMVIAVVALIVIGPERLPRVARTMGHLFGRLQRYVNDVKADINREIELEELRKFKTTFEDAARGFETSVNTTVNSVQTEVNKTESELNALAQGGEPAAPPAPDFDPAFGPTPDVARTAPEEPATEAKGGTDSRPEKSSV